MKVSTKFVEKVSLEEFADKYNLELEVIERVSPMPGVAPFYAHFKHVKIMDRCFLRSTTGNGDTPAAAVHDYAREISRKRIVANAYRNDRREMDVPDLHFAGRVGTLIDVEA